MIVAALGSSSTAIAIEGRPIAMPSLTRSNIACRSAGLVKMKGTFFAPMRHSHSRTMPRRAMLWLSMHKLSGTGFRQSKPVSSVFIL